VRVVVETADGRFSVDAETDEVEPTEEELPPLSAPGVGLPRVRATAAAGSTVVALVDARPPLLISYDAGSSWRDAGRGLPAGRAIAILDENPDVVAYAARNRLYLSTDGGRFWSALAVELPEILALGLVA
jgi:hypothetical protein